MQTALDRRTFLKRARGRGGGLRAWAPSSGSWHATPSGKANRRSAQPYGPLRRVADQRGVEVLALPAGFSYVTFSHSGSTMSDGNPTPLALDGMGAFAGGRGHRGHGRGKEHLVRLVRNSEDRNPAGTVGGLLGDRSKAYDPTGYGGTSTLVYDEHRRRLVEDFVSLNGTTVNCAGGIAYRHRYWLTGEETVGGPDARRPTRASRSATATCSRRRSTATRTSSSRRADHAPRAGSPTRRRPSTSARASSTRPRTRARASARASTATRPTTRTTYGGRGLTCSRSPGRRTSTCGRVGPAGRRSRSGGCGSTSPTPTLTSARGPRSTFNQGWAKGAAKFNRLEGCWEDDRTIFFVSTSGGDRKNGDVNSDGYRGGVRPGLGLPPRPQAAGRSCSSTSRGAAAELDSPDNLTVTPRGGLIACEDDASSAYVDTHLLAPGIENVNRLIGITQGGDAFEFAVNVLNGSELAGACFSPSGRTLFFNLFGRAAFTEDPTEGMTVAVTGPWRRGPL